MCSMMKRFVRKIRYAGLSKAEFDSILPNIHRENRMNLMNFSAISCVFLLVMMLLSLSLEAAAVNRWLYLPVLLLLAGIFFASCMIKDPDSPVLQAAIYTFVITLFLFGMCLGTFASRDRLAVTFAVLLFTVPLLFTDKPIRMILCIAAAVICFVITAIQVKERSLLETDIGNAIIFGMISAVVSTYMMSVKCQRFLYARKVAELSETDLLTGLRNRNSYEQRLRAFSALQNEALSCIYVDANGLHELNDTKGHEAGDEMLRFVGSTLQSQFGKENTFRIGGDEFVVLLAGEQEQTVQEKIKRSRCILTERSYCVSVGYSQGEPSQIGLPALIRQAEKQMYEEKREFYHAAGIDRRKRV